MLTIQIEGPEFKSQHSNENLGVAVCTCNSVALGEGGEDEGSRGF